MREARDSGHSCIFIAHNIHHVFQVVDRIVVLRHGRVIADDIDPQTTSVEAVERVMGRNAHEVMWDDSIGYGLQMALFDAVGKTLEVPVHALLGEKVRDRAKLSWWAIDMPAEDWASECREALDLGYRDFKAKGRPWQDVYAQLDALHEIVPDDFNIDMDFNSTLLDPEHAIPILQRLEKTLPY
mgnify:CR=1 FL=1